MATPLRDLRGRETQLLTQAHRARSKGQEREAMRLYRRILVENPRNSEVALRVAPMLAWAGESFEAWQLYRRIALEYARMKKYNECLAVYREACRYVPFEFEAWRLCAELQLRMKRLDGAFETLIDGRMHFRGPQSRAQAIALLTRAREIEPWDDDLLLDLGALYGANNQSDLALEILSTLACRTRGRRLRRVRLLQFRLSWAFRFLYLWTRSFGESTNEPTRADIGDIGSGRPPARRASSSVRATAA